MMGTNAVQVAASVAPALESFTFEQFTSKFSKLYEPSEHLSRKATFALNMEGILKQNAKYDAGESTWYAGLNEFTDWTSEEFSQRRNGRMPIASSMAKPRAIESVESAEAVNTGAVDWRWAATPVKNQGGCGSCWAFASTEIMESYYFINNASGSRELPVLAPQALVDCAPNTQHCGGTGGCEGSIADLAFNYTGTMGMPLEKDLPYVGRDATCPDDIKPFLRVGGTGSLLKNSARELENTLSSTGPVVINVAAMSWQSYAGGVYSGGCSESDCTIDHVVVAYGYGPGYWLVRNSWGPTWGESGYIRLTRDNDATTYTDTRPADGVACMPFPKVQYPMGESGLLLDMVIPLNVNPW